MAGHTKMKERRTYGPIEVLVLVVGMKEIEHLAVFVRGAATCGDQQAHVERRETNSECRNHEVSKALSGHVLFGVAVDAVVGDQIRHAVDRVTVEGRENGGADGGVEKVGAHEQPTSEFGDRRLDAWRARGHVPE